MKKLADVNYSERQYCGKDFELLLRKPTNWTQQAHLGGRPCYWTRTKWDGTVGHFRWRLVGDGDWVAQRGLGGGWEAEPT